MSFFFDVWTSEGFVLASDVRLIVNDKPEHAHKIASSGHSSRVKCAIAVCGEYPNNCLNYFSEATLAKDTLRQIAQHFASKWVERYGGTKQYSAVHLVGFEEIDAPEKVVPQMWFWSNWDGRHYRSKEFLAQQLQTFSEPIPHNNHIPHKIKQLTGRFPGPTLEEEQSLVAAFLKLHQPYFTWNGDIGFWQSAADVVGSAMRLLTANRTNWTIKEASDVTEACLKFLIQIGNLLPDSTVGLSAKGEFDMLQVTEKGSEWIISASFDN